MLAMSKKTVIIFMELAVVLIGGCCRKTVRFGVVADVQHYSGMN